MKRLGWLHGLILDLPAAGLVRALGISAQILLEREGYDTSTQCSLPATQGQHWKDGNSHAEGRLP